MSSRKKDSYTTSYCFCICRRLVFFQLSLLNRSSFRFGMYGGFRVKATLCFLLLLGTTHILQCTAEDDNEFAEFEDMEVEEQNSGEGEKPVLSRDDDQNSPSTANVCFHDKVFSSSILGSSSYILQIHLISALKATVPEMVSNEKITCHFLLFFNFFFFVR